MLEEDRYGEAVSALRPGIETWTRLGGHVRIPYVKSAMAEAIAREGDLETGLRLVDECLEQIDRPAWLIRPGALMRGANLKATR